MSGATLGGNNPFQCVLPPWISQGISLLSLRIGAGCPVRPTNTVCTAGTSWVQPLCCRGSAPPPPAQTNRQHVPAKWGLGQALSNHLGQSTSTHQLSASPAGLRTGPWCQPTSKSSHGSPTENGRSLGVMGSSTGLVCGPQQHLELFYESESTSTVRTCLPCASRHCPKPTGTGKLASPAHFCCPRPRYAGCRHWGWGYPPCVG